MNCTRRNLSSLNARSVFCANLRFQLSFFLVGVVGVKCLCSQDSSSVPCITEVFPLQDTSSSLIRAEDFPSRTAFVQKVQRGRAQRSSNLGRSKTTLKSSRNWRGQRQNRNPRGRRLTESDRDAFYVISKSRLNKADKKL